MTSEIKYLNKFYLTKILTALHFLSIIGSSSLSLELELSLYPYEDFFKGFLVALAAEGRALFKDLLTNSNLSFLLFSASAFLAMTSKSLSLSSSADNRVLIKGDYVTFVENKTWGCYTYYL